jgi:cytochrome c
VPKWDFNHIYMFLGGPQAYIDGTKMSFVGIKDPQERINLIAWLRQQSSNPVPIPPADPKAAAADTAAGAAQPSGPAAGAPKGPAAVSATPAGASSGASTAVSSQTGTGAASSPASSTSPGGTGSPK